MPSLVAAPAALWGADSVLIAVLPGAFGLEPAEDVTEVSFWGWAQGWVPLQEGLRQVDLLHPHFDFPIQEMGPTWQVINWHQVIVFVLCDRLGEGSL